MKSDFREEPQFYVCTGKSGVSDTYFLPFLSVVQVAYHDLGQLWNIYSCPFLTLMLFVYHSTSFFCFCF
jgi:hypothetical protein